MKSLILVFTLLISVSSHASISWKKVHAEDNINIFSKPSEKGVLPFRATGSISAPLNIVLQTLMDLKNKNAWSPKLKNIKVFRVKTF